MSESSRHIVTLDELDTAHDAWMEVVARKGTDNTSFYEKLRAAIQAYEDTRAPLQNGGTDGDLRNDLLKGIGGYLEKNHPDNDISYDAMADYVAGKLSQVGDATRFELNQRVSFNNGKHVFLGHVDQIERPYTIYHVQLNDGSRYRCYGDDPKIQPIDSTIAGKGEL